MKNKTQITTFCLLVILNLLISIESYGTSDCFTKTQTFNANKDSNIWITSDEKYFAEGKLDQNNTRTEIYYDIENFKKVELPISDKYFSRWSYRDGLFYNLSYINKNFEYKTNSVSEYLSNVNTIVYNPENQSFEILKNTIKLPESLVPYSITIDKNKHFIFENFEGTQKFILKPKFEIFIDLMAIKLIDNKLYYFDKKSKTLYQITESADLIKFFRIHDIPSSTEDYTILPTSPISVVNGEHRFWYDSKTNTVLYDRVINKDSRIVFQDDSSSYVYNSTKDTVTRVPKILNIYSIIDHGPNICITSFDPWKNVTVESEERSGYQTNCYNPSTNARFTQRLTNDNPDFLYYITQNKTKLYISSKSNSIYLEKDRLNCTNQTYFMDIKTSLIDTSPKINIPFTQFNDDLTNACKNEFTPELWNKINNLSKFGLTEEDAYRWLMQFSKSGGFSPELHHSILSVILKSNFTVDIKNEISYAMSVINNQYPNYISNNFKDYKDKKYDFTQMPKCISDSTKNLMIDVLKNEAFNFIKNTSDAEQITEYLTNKSKILEGNLSIQQRDEIAKEYKERMVILARNDDDFENMFSSKVGIFAYNFALRTLGLASRKLTDITTVKITDSTKKSYLKILLIGSEPCSKCVFTDFGFYKREFAKLSKFELADETNFSVKFDYNNTKFKAEYQISPVEIDSPVDHSDAPNYEELWKDNVLRGLIVTNQNDDEGIRILRHYYNYYNRNGFVFNKATHVENFQDFLKDRIMGNVQIDYFLKEAHSDGDEINLFRAPIKAYLYEGFKQLENGQSEVIEILIPAKDTETKLISNSDFASWMSDRTEAGGGQLIYINSSCNSYTKAAYEISAVAAKNTKASKKFVNLATTSYVYFFRDLISNNPNDKYNAKRFLLDGLRDGKNYVEIRDLLKQDPRYSSKLGNIFVFPDDESDYKLVLDGLDLPILIEPLLQVQNADGSWRKYNLDENWNTR